MWCISHLVRLDSACDGLIGVDRVLGESSWRMRLTKERLELESQGGEGEGVLHFQVDFFLSV